MNWIIRKFNKNRFAIYDKNTNKILYNANGYGYKSEKAARKVAWYYFGKGKNLIKEAQEFWKNNQKFRDDLNYEAICRLKDGDEFEDYEEFATNLAKQYNIKNFKPIYLKY